MIERLIGRSNRFSDKFDTGEREEVVLVYASGQQT